MSAAAGAVEVVRAEPDLIDRIANALPEDVRAEYYRELRHCRSLPENDEMLRLLRAMQFLVLLIEQAPGRLAEERGRLESLLTTAIDNVNRMSTASEAWHISLQRRLTALPADIAYGISPEAVAAKINDHLHQEFVRSAIPRTANDLALISDRMQKVCQDFSTASDSLGNEYRGAAEDARQAVASLNEEITDAAKAAARFTDEVSERFSRAYRGVLAMLVCGALVIGLAIGMALESWVMSPQQAFVVTPPPVVQTAPPPVQAVQPTVRKTPFTKAPAPKAQTAQ
ncbi:MAG: hypothetical protein KGN84_09380 [Acidobacteriota bacterium]|nr:hypothetical protein [Acidobacteriota bacterium]